MRGHVIGAARRRPAQMACCHRCMHAVTKWKTNTISWMTWNYESIARNSLTRVQQAHNAKVAISSCYVHAWTLITSAIVFSLAVTPFDVMFSFFLFPFPDLLHSVHRPHWWSRAKFTYSCVRHTAHDFVVLRNIRHILGAQHCLSDWQSHSWRVSAPICIHSLTACKPERHTHIRNQPI